MSKKFSQHQQLSFARSPLGHLDSNQKFGGNSSIVTSVKFGSFRQMPDFVAVNDFGTRAALQDFEQVQRYEYLATKPRFGHMIQEGKP